MLRNHFFHSTSIAVVNLWKATQSNGMWKATMQTTIVFSLLLGLVVAFAAQTGCGAPPDTQVDKTASVAQIEKNVETEPIQLPAPLPKSSQANSAQPIVSARAEDEPQVVEVGYKKGMHVPEFGVSLHDGTKLTSASLIEEGKPTFIYFHATW